MMIVVSFINFFSSLSHSLVCGSDPLRYDPIRAVKTTTIHQAKEYKEHHHYEIKYLILDRKKYSG
jgi:hypothetical protein